MLFKRQKFDWALVALLALGLFLYGSCQPRFRLRSAMPEDFVDAPLARSPQKPEDLSYLAATSRDYHLSLHRLQGEERFHLALDEHGRVMDVCRSGQRKAGLVRVPG